MARRTDRPSKRRPPGFGRDVRYLLDKFSQEDLRTWNRIADDAERYWVGLYYHLEAQRQINRKALVNALASVPSAKLSETPWYRVIDFQYSLQPLSLKGSLTVGAVRLQIDLERLFDLNRLNNLQAFAAIIRKFHHERRVNCSCKVTG